MPNFFEDEKIRYKTNREITAETTQFNLNEITLYGIILNILLGVRLKTTYYKYWFNRDPNKKYTKLVIISVIQ